MGKTDSKQRQSPDFSREARLIATGAKPVAGIDEAGRGPLAGPVVAAAVILPAARIPPGLNDSKALSQTRRDALFDAITAVADIGVGIAGVDRIDEDNILQASLWAMAEAAGQLRFAPAVALIDGTHAPALECKTMTLVGGDHLSVSIAAASIIAKVTRDRLMVELSREFPGYGWDRNKGYGTAEHLAALAKMGPALHHRRSFRPVREVLTLR